MEKGNDVSNSLNWAPGLQIFLLLVMGRAFGPVRLEWMDWYWSTKIFNCCISVPGMVEERQETG